MTLIFRVLVLLPTATNKEGNNMANFSKGDKVFISKLKCVRRWIDNDDRFYSFNRFDFDGNAVFDVVISGKVWAEEVLCNIYQVKEHLCLA